MFWFKGTIDLELKDSDKYGSYQYYTDYLDPNFGFQMIQGVFFLTGTPPKKFKVQKS